MEKDPFLGLHATCRIYAILELPHPVPKVGVEKASSFLGCSDLGGSF
jgi:hypothetical protein